MDGIHSALAHDAFLHRGPVEGGFTPQLHATIDPGIEWVPSRARAHARYQDYERCRRTGGAGDL